MKADTTLNNKNNSNKINNFRGDIKKIKRVKYFKEKKLRLKSKYNKNNNDIFERLFVNRVSQKELLYKINNNANNAHG